MKNFGFILNAPVQILRTSAMLDHTSTFAIPALGEHLVLVSGEDDIQAVCNSDENVLSFHEAMTDVSSYPFLSGVASHCVAADEALLYHVGV